MECPIYGGSLLIGRSLSLSNLPRRSLFSSSEMSNSYLSDKRLGKCVEVSIDKKLTLSGQQVEHCLIFNQVFGNCVTSAHMVPPGPSC